MSEAKHTRGPWEFVVEDGSRKIVAPTTDARLRTRETLMCDTQYYPWCPDKDEDWHLIAASPALYEALREVSQSLAWLAFGECRGFSDNLPTANNALEKARAALSLAEGKEQA